MDDRDIPSLSLERYETIHEAMTSENPIDMQPGELEAYENDKAFLKEKAVSWNATLTPAMPGVTAALEKAAATQREVAGKLMADIRGPVGPAMSHHGHNNQLEALAKQNEQLSAFVNRRRAEREDREIASMELSGNQLTALEAMSIHLISQTKETANLGAALERQETYTLQLEKDRKLEKRKSDSSDKRWKIWGVVLGVLTLVASIVSAIR